MPYLGSDERCGSCGTLSRAIKGDFSSGLSWSVTDLIEWRPDQDFMSSGRGSEPAFKWVGSSQQKSELCLESLHVSQTEGSRALPPQTGAVTARRATPGFTR